MKLLLIHSTLLAIFITFVNMDYSAREIASVNFEDMNGANENISEISRAMTENYNTMKQSESEVFEILDLGEPTVEELEP